MLWTVARVVWGLSALTAVVEFQRLVGSATSFREQVSAVNGRSGGRNWNQIAEVSGRKIRDGWSCCVDDTVRM